MKNVVIVCDDIFGAEIYSILKAVNAICEQEGRSPEYGIVGFISYQVDPFKGVSIPLPRLGNIDIWSPMINETCVLGMRAPEAKRRAVERLRARGVVFETVRAPWIRGRGPADITACEGSIIAPYSCATCLHVGRFVTLIGPMLTGERIGDYSTIMHFANVAGSVGSDVYIGSHCFIPVDKTIGDGAFIEDGSIVTRSVKPGLRFTGVPARKVKQI